MRPRRAPNPPLAQSSRSHTGAYNAFSLDTPSDLAWMLIRARLMASLYRDFRDILDRLGADPRN